MERRVASLEHEQLVAALSAVGTVLTPKTAPSTEGLRPRRPRASWLPPAPK